MKKINFIILFLFTLTAHGAGTKLLKPFKTIRLHFNEPSEICLAPDNKTFYLLSDKAILCNIDSLGNLISKASTIAYDIEGATVVQDKIYVVDESLRQILIFEVGSLKLLRTVQLQFNGPRNTSFESITMNPISGHFIIATEKNPQLFFEYNNEFINTNQFSIPGINEVSGMTWHNNQWWIMSDEQETVFQVDPSNNQIIGKWSLPIINPEGMCFDDQNNLIIVSDDMGKMFYFKNPAQ